MKKNEFYRHKWNKYVAKITDVKRDRVELKTVNSGVTETISKENFDLNYVPCVTIHEWRNTISDVFSFGDVLLMGDTVRVKVDDTIVDFSIDSSNQFAVCFTDDVKEAIEADSNIMRFLLEDADEVIDMFADLFTE